MVALLQEILLKIILPVIRHAHRHNQIREFAVRMYLLDQLGKPTFHSRYVHPPLVTEQSEGPMDIVTSSIVGSLAKQKFWSDYTACADAKADLSLRWAHSHIVGFVMRRLISKQRERRVSSDVSHMSLVTRKPFYGDCDQVRLKPGCSASEAR